MRSLIRLALAACLLPQVAPNAHAPSAVAPGQPPASRLASSKLARSLSEAGRRLQLRRLERTRGGEAQAEGGAEAEQQDGGVDAARVESHAEVDRTRRGFYPRVYEAIADAESNGYGREECSAFCVQQVQGTGDCLFHSIAIGMAFADEGAHLDMYDPSLGKIVERLRQQAVDTLVEDPKRVLHIEADQTITTDELVAAAAEQYSMTPQEYCSQMRNKGVWGGGPEILALVNRLRRPIHVFEPVPACNGTQVQMQLCGAFGSPEFDHCGARVCILAADDRFPNCKPNEVKRHGEGGNHFLALLPRPRSSVGSGVADYPPGQGAEGEGEGAGGPMPPPEGR